MGTALDPFSLKTRETARISPWDQIGGSMEFNPSKLVADGGSFMKDAAEAIGGLVEIVIAQPSPESSKPQIGGKTEIPFNNPAETQLQKARLELVQANKTNQEVQRATESHEIQEEVRLEVVGMSEEQLAEEGDFSNTSVKGPLVKSIANKMWVFLKLIDRKLQMTKEKVVASKIFMGRVDKSGKGFVMGENELGLGGENKNHFTAAVG